MWPRSTVFGSFVSPAHTEENDDRRHRSQISLGAGSVGSRPWITGFAVQTSRFRIPFPLTSTTLPGTKTHNFLDSCTGQHPEAQTAAPPSPLSAYQPSQRAEAPQQENSMRIACDNGTQSSAGNTATNFCMETSISKVSAFRGFKQAPTSPTTPYAFPGKSPVPPSEVVRGTKLWERLCIFVRGVKIKAIGWRLGGVGCTTAPPAALLSTGESGIVDCAGILS